MNNPIEPMLTLYQAQLQASKDFAELVLSGAEHINHIALQAAKDGLCEQLDKAQALAAANDPQSAAALRDTLAQPNFERATACSRELLKTLSDAYAGMTGVCVAYMKEFDHSAMDAVRNVPQKPTEGTGVGAAGNMFEVWDTAWRQFNAITEQYVRAAQAGGGDANAAIAAGKPAPAADPRPPARTM